MFENVFSKEPLRIPVVRYFAAVIVFRVANVPHLNIHKVQKCIPDSY